MDINAIVNQCANAPAYVSPYPVLSNKQEPGKTACDTVGTEALNKQDADAPTYVSLYPPLIDVEELDETTHDEVGTGLPVSSGSAELPGPISADLETSPRKTLPSSSPSVHQLAGVSPSNAASFTIRSSSASKTKPSKPLTKSPGAIPPELPPSVEAAYRKKCIQLKQRMNEVEEANDAARQRLARLNRSVQKLRLERAFLLEQLAKRTSTNVEDSEGSPSPPPTVRAPHPSSAHILMMTDKLTPLPS
jgi:hypothetical protein